MAWVALVVGGLLVFAIAAAFVGSEAFRLGHETPSAIFDMDEAAQEVGAALPVAVQARLTYDEVRTLIAASLTHLESKQRDQVVVSDDDAVAVVLGAVDREGMDVSDDDAYEVIQCLLAHLDGIGALGPPASQ